MARGLFVIGRSRRPVSATLIFGSLILLAFLVVGLIPKSFAPYDPVEFDYLAVLSPPSSAHPFGTDNFGRDVLSRVIWGARVDLQIALGGTVVAVLIGTIIGAFVGYFGGWAEIVFGRVVDIFVAFPFLVLVIAIIAVLGPGLINMYIAVSVVGWVAYARLIRSEILIQNEMDYSVAGRGMGYTSARIIFRHLMPNAITPVIIFWMTDMALVILLGSSLGYLGLGAQPPTPEWGVLIASGKSYMSTAWWISTFPGVAIVFVGIGFSLVGDGLADLLRPGR